MGWEIERKFLVIGDGWRADKPLSLRQGYLNRSPECSVRVRIEDEHAFLTIKGITRGMMREEFEYSIPSDDAEQLLESLCQRPLVEKRRHIVEHAGRRWEVDEFLGDNAGLIVAEIELESPDTELELPEWVGQEVTSDPRYYNSNLVHHPFSEWK